MKHTFSRDPGLGQDALPTELALPVPAESVRPSDRLEHRPPDDPVGAQDMGGWRGLPKAQRDINIGGAALVRTAVVDGKAKRG